VGEEFVVAYFKAGRIVLSYPVGHYTVPFRLVLNTLIAHGRIQ